MNLNKTNGSGDGIQLLALDLDGTLLNEKGKVTPASVAAIQAAREKGLTVVIATGRDYDAIPWKELPKEEIPYAVTTNGSALYRTEDRKCLFEEPLPEELAVPIFEDLRHRPVYTELFVDGTAYVPAECSEIISRLAIPGYLKDLIRSKQKTVEDLSGFLAKEGSRIQKGTMNFIRMEDGTYLQRDEIRRMLEDTGRLTVVNGGFDNLEFTKAGVDKSVGIQFLSKLLKIPMEQVMAVGDSENDQGMLLAAGVGVAMGNALEHIKKEADWVTGTNAEEGMAQAIRKIL